MKRRKSSNSAKAAIAAINESKKLGNTSLTLEGLGLTEIPPEVFTLTHLTNLNLARNRLAAIPPEIGKLKNLHVLKVSRNRIEVLPKDIGELEHLESLLANMNSLSSIPPEVQNLKQISELDFENNRIEAIPSWISKLSKLRTLRVSGSWSAERLDPNTVEWLVRASWLENLTLSAFNFTEAPEWLRGCERLTQLDLSFNEIALLPNWFSELIGLRFLNLSQNQLDAFPVQILDLRELEFLSLGDNRINAIPDDVSKLSNLECLYLYRTNISRLPQSITHLQHLKKLLLWNCRFESFPEELYELKNLEYVSFDNNTTNSETRNENKIKEIGPQIVNLKNLVTLRLKDNPILRPPPEVVSRGLDAIRQYFSDLEEGEDHLLEAKLLIVGEGGAGKTTFARKVENPLYVLTEQEKSTEGIEITRWDFMLPDGKVFRVNIWDFGGQEIYHATHQFFLTSRSLYALVADTRKEDTDFYYWLNIVELLSDASPILIIKNEKQDRHREINEQQFRAQFSNLQKILPINLATNRGLVATIDEVKHEITHLPHIGTPLPKTWVEVRERLERDSRDYIDVEEFLKICEESGFNDKTRKLRLSEYLHDLGVVLHFQRDPLLKRVVILKPKWGTDAVYKVLDNRKVINNLGRFNKNDLRSIWAEPAYVEKQDELLQLMINFKLCYRIGEGDFYIAPQLLSENQPTYEWDSRENLSLRFTYDFMPKGIVTQLIVAVHPLVDKQEYVWKSGMILDNGYAKAEILEYYGLREIRIRVSGNHKKDLLTIITYELEKIHKTFRLLKYRALIPCNCQVCTVNNEPHFFSLDVLKKFLGDRQENIQCLVSYQMVGIRGLVDEVIDQKRLEQVSRAEGEIVFYGDVGTVILDKSHPGDTTMVDKYSATQKIRSPWASGSFYLFVFVIVIAGLGVLAKSLSPLVLPIVLIAGILLVPIIGALQLRQDDRFSESSFLQLMQMAIGQLPLIRSLKRSNQDQSQS